MDIYDIDGQPITSKQWGQLHDDKDYARVGFDRLNLDGVELDVSTVWLGLNHQWGDGPPLIFETMIFGLKDDDPCWRYSTKEEAEEGHKRIVTMLTTGLTGRQLRELLS